VHIVSFAVFTIAFSAMAVAQPGGSASSGGRVTPDRSTPERPAQTPALLGAGECDPATVIGTCPGTYSFGYGFTANDRPRHGGPQTLKAGLSFLVYFTRRTFFEIDQDNVVSIKPAIGNRVTGVGDTTLYVGADALLEGKGRPGISVLYGIKLPSASSTKGIGSGEVDHVLIAAIGKTFGRTYLEFDGGDYIAGRSNATGFDHLPFASAFVNHKLGNSGKYKLHFEIGGDFATSVSNADMYSLNYLETRLSGKDARTVVAFRAGAKFGLTPNVSRAGLYLSLKVGGNLTNIF